jgi:hypothetical protein
LRKICQVALCTAITLYSLGLASEGLQPRWTGDFLEVASPKLHFLTGRQLDRLRNGAAVPFDFQLTLSAGPGLLVHRSLERFVVSYDLWEERFSVVRLRNSRRSAAHLTAAAAETWCLDNIAIPSFAVPSDKPFWLKLEIRSAESKQIAPIADEGGVSLATLIELFSHPTRNTQGHWESEAGPFRLSDLRRQ